MRTRDERTLKLVENYKRDFDSGLSPLEIAKKYGVSSASMYRATFVVAEREGVPRESLLKRTNENQPTTETKSSTLLDNDEFNVRGMAILKEIKAAKTEMNQFISEQEKIAKSFKK